MRPADGVDVLAYCCTSLLPGVPSDTESLLGWRSGIATEVIVWADRVVRLYDGVRSVVRFGGTGTTPLMVTVRSGSLCFSTDLSPLRRRTGCHTTPQASDSPQTQFS